MRFEDKIYITNEDFSSMIKSLAKELAGIRPDLIVGITRGGLVPAVHLSHALGVPMDTIYWSTRDSSQAEVNATIMDMINEEKTVVFVDDINDTGTTFEQISNVYDPNGMEQVYMMALIERASSSFSSDGVCLRIDDPRWVVFPWEQN